MLMVFVVMKSVILCWPVLSASHLTRLINTIKYKSSNNSVWIPCFFILISEAGITVIKVFISHRHIFVAVGCRKEQVKPLREEVKFTLIIIEVDRKVRMFAHSLSLSVRRLVSPQSPLLQSLCVSIITANSFFFLFSHFCFTVLIHFLGDINLNVC